MTLRVKSCEDNLFSGKHFSVPQPLLFSLPELRKPLALISFVNFIVVGIKIIVKVAEQGAEVMHLKQGIAYSLEVNR